MAQPSSSLPSGFSRESQAPKFLLAIYSAHFLRQLSFLPSPLTPVAGIFSSLWATPNWNISPLLKIYLCKCKIKDIDFKWNLGGKLGFVIVITQWKCYCSYQLTLDVLVFNYPSTRNLWLSCFLLSLSTLLSLHSSSPDSLLSSPQNILDPIMSCTLQHIPHAPNTSHLSILCREIHSLLFFF